MKVLLFVAALATACMSAGSTGITASDIPCDSSLTYANFGSDFIKTNCLSCHQFQDTPRLQTQSLVQANVARILDEAVYTDAMPENANLANADRIKLGQWLSCGAP